MDIDTAGKDKKTALYTAVEKNNPGIVKILLGSNPDLEVTNKVRMGAWQALLLADKVRP